MSQEETKETRGLDAVSSEAIDSDSFIPRHGGYHNLLSYGKALFVYEATLHFCGRFFSKCDRTWEQMIQAARFAKHNNIEDSRVEGRGARRECLVRNTVA
jgi:hypothetical protein